jgi:hypothetical protein
LHVVCGAIAANLSSDRSIFDPASDSFGEARHDAREARALA